MIRCTMAKLTESDKKNIIDRYKTGDTTLAELGRDYNVTYGAISMLLRKNHIPINNDFTKLCRKYTLNEHCFDTIDSEESAYWLGLLYADGCNSDTSNTIGITLIESDKYLLEKLALFMGSNRPITFQNLKTKNQNWSNVYTLSVTSKTLCNKLDQLGCIPRKSLKLKFPNAKQVPDHLISHFMRGYSDGDGCITYSKKSQLSSSCRWSIISTLDFCESLSNVINNALNLKGLIYQNADGNGITQCLEFSAYKKCIPVLNWLYKDATIYMNRKYVKYQHILELNRTRPGKPARIKDPKTGRYIKEVIDVQ